MFRATGVDLGHTETRVVTVGQLWGAPVRESLTLENLKSPFVGMPSDQLTIRTLNVPESNREVQGNVIKEELGLSLPFAVSDASWDWIVNENNATVAVTLNTQLASFKKGLPAEAVVEAEPFGYLRICRSLKLEEALVFDFGATRTVTCAIKEGSIAWVRVSFRGGRSLTHEIAVEHDLGSEEAEKHKQALGMEEPKCQQWLADIVNGSLLVNPVPFDKVFICGGGAQMKGLSDELGRLLGHPVELLPMPTGLSPYQDAAAYGAALAGKPGAARIDLKETVQETVQAIPWSLAIWLVVLLLLATVNLELHHYTADKVLKQQIAVYQQAAKKVLPQLATQEPESYQAELNKLTDANISSKRSSPEYILEIMAQLARPLSHQAPLEIRNFDFNSEKNTPTITMGGKAGSPQQVEEFRRGVEGILQKPEILENKKSRQDAVTFSLEGGVPTP